MPRAPFQQRIQIKDIQLTTDKTLMVQLPVGVYRYKGLLLELGNTRAGDANAPSLASLGTEFRLNYAGGIQRKATLAQAAAIYLGYGAQFGEEAYNAPFGGGNGTGRRQLYISLCENWRKRSSDGDALGWQTGFMSAARDVFQLQVDLATCDFSQVFADVDDFGPSIGGATAPHPIMKWDRNIFNVAATPFQTQRLDKKDVYAELDIFDTSDGKTVDYAKLEQGSVPLWERWTKYQKNTFLKVVGDMNPQAGIYQIVGDTDDDLRNCFAAQGLTLTTEFNAAPSGNMEVIGQRFGLPE